MPYSIEAYEDAKYTMGFEYGDNKKEEVKANTIFLEYSTSSKQSDKYDFIRKKAKDIIDSASKDIIIVAGDG